MLNVLGDPLASCAALHTKNRFLSTAIHFCNMIPFYKRSIMCSFLSCLLLRSLWKRKILFAALSKRRKIRQPRQHLKWRAHIVVWMHNFLLCHALQSLHPFSSASALTSRRTNLFERWQFNQDAGFMSTTRWVNLSSDLHGDLVALQLQWLQLAVDLWNSCDDAFKPLPTLQRIKIHG